MKWVLFILGMACVIPVGRWLRSTPKAHRWVWMLVGFLPFFGLDSVDINLVSYEHYRGDSRGIEITAVDLLALCMYIALPASRASAPASRLSVAYLLLMSVSLFYAMEPMFSAFSVWKAVRLVFLARVVGRACQDPSVPPALLTGMSLGILYELFLALQQRYLLHMHQVQGNFPHQNTLGMAVNLVAPLAFALWLGGSRSRINPIVVGAGGICIVLTLSRGAMTMFACGLAFAYLVSLARRTTNRKIMLGVAAIASAAAMVAYSWNTIVDRFTNAPKESAESRLQFEDAAAYMLADHALGVGINHYSLALEQAGYGAAAGINGYDTSGIVHNIYWLTAAEMGYPGLLAFLGLLATPLVQIVRTVRIRGGDIRDDALVGIGTGLVLMYAQGRLEWALRQTTLSYLFWILLAIVHALSWSMRQEVGARAKAVSS